MGSQKSKVKKDDKRQNSTWKLKIKILGTINKIRKWIGKAFLVNKVLEHQHRAVDFWLPMQIIRSETKLGGLISRDELITDENWVCRSGLRSILKGLGYKLRFWVFKTSHPNLADCPNLLLNWLSLVCPGLARPKRNVLMSTGGFAPAEWSPCTVCP